MFGCLVRGRWTLWSADSKFNLWGMKILPDSVVKQPYRDEDKWQTVAPVYQLVQLPKELPGAVAASRRRWDVFSMSDDGLTDVLLSLTTSASSSRQSRTEPVVYQVFLPLRYNYFEASTHEQKEKSHFNFLYVSVIFTWAMTNVKMFKNSWIW